MRRRCGKAKCRCAGKDGILHESPALSCNVGGRSYSVTLMPEDIPLVKAALKRHRDEQERLATDCLKGVRWLQDRVKARRLQRGR
jgi:hypothetical protein